jgi:hypothetical protein
MVSASKSELMEGGMQAWLTLIGGFFCLFCSFGIAITDANLGFINATGTLQTYYEQNQLAEYTPSQIGWISSTMIFIALLGVSTPFY